jgi:hypothetical protein
MGNIARIHIRDCPAATSAQEQITDSYFRITA